MEIDAPAEFEDLESAETQYHSVSALAIAALVIGLLSPLAFAHALWWALPIAGAALSAAAIVRIDRSDGALVGRPAAVLGLALALVCGLAAVTQASTRRLWLGYRAERVAERFLDLLRDGKSYEAHQLWTRPQFLFLPGGDYKTLYKENAPANKDYEGFMAREVIRDLLALGEKAELEHVDTRLTYSEPNRDYLMVFYRLRGTTPEAKIDKSIKFVIERLTDEERVVRWRVYSDEVVLE